MSEARRRRRAMEKAFGFKKPKNVLSKEAIELRDRKMKAGKEIHRQNLERNENRKLEKDSDVVESIKDSISLDISDIDNDTISLKNNPYDFLENDSSSGISVSGA